MPEKGTGEREGNNLGSSIDHSAAALALVWSGKRHVVMKDPIDSIPRRRCENIYFGSVKVQLRRCHAYSHTCSSECYPHAESGAHDRLACRSSEVLELVYMI